MRSRQFDGYRIRHAQRHDLSYLPKIKKAAAIRFEPYGLAATMATIVTSEEVFSRRL